MHTLTVYVCVYGIRTRGWHAGDDKYDDSDDIKVGSANKLWLLCIIKFGQLAELC